MKCIKQLERYQKIDQLIRTECTGTPHELSDKLGVHRSHVYRLLQTLKDYGAEIEYSRKQQCFYYKTPFNLDELLPRNSLSFIKMEKINGGFAINTTLSFFMRRNNITLANCFAQNRDINYKCL
jgi:biotin operon repressor